MKIFQTATIGSLNIKNRIVRSATYEGMCDEKYSTRCYLKERK